MPKHICTPIREHTLARARIFGQWTFGQWTNRQYGHVGIESFVYREIELLIICSQLERSKNGVNRTNLGSEGHLGSADIWAVRNQKVPGHLGSDSNF